MYRENLFEIVEGMGENVTGLILPKNTGLKGYAWTMLKEAGFDLREAEEIGDNRLRMGELEVLLKRGEDIPQVVMDQFQMGVLMLGLTGDDLYDEFCLGNRRNTLQVENTYDWFDPVARYLRPALCLINSSGDMEDIPDEGSVAVNRKYDMTSYNYLMERVAFMKPL
tara:strand:+ start:159 stop:659 length:501 start_codon:yes stop_codon:yes gene_type:complete